MSMETRWDACSAAWESAADGVGIGKTRDEIGDQETTNEELWMGDIAEMVNFVRQLNVPR